MFTAPLKYLHIFSNAICSEKFQLAEQNWKCRAIPQVQGGVSAGGWQSGFLLDLVMVIWRLQTRIRAEMKSCGYGELLEFLHRGTCRAPRVCRHKPSPSSEAVLAPAEILAAHSSF